jgi:hypothetical protein
MAYATAELYWLRMLFKELRLPLTTPPCLYCDNLGALALASNSIFHARTKHIEVDYHFNREKILHKDLVAHYISTEDHCADIFTKGLTSARFLFLRDKLMVTSLPMSLRGAVRGVTSTSACSNSSSTEQDQPPKASELWLLPP